MDMRQHGTMVTNDVSYKDYMDAYFNVYDHLMEDDKMAADDYEGYVAALHKQGKVCPLLIELVTH